MLLHGKMIWTFKMLKLFMCNNCNVKEAWSHYQKIHS